MKINVRYLGFIKNMLGKEREEFTIGKGSLLSDLLNRLSQIYGSAFKKEVYEPGDNDVKTGFVVTVNGILSKQLEGIDTKLKQGDTVILMTLMSGG
jgi:MoaD family protein